MGWTLLIDGLVLVSQGVNGFCVE